VLFLLRDLLDRIALIINAPAGLVAMNAPRAIFTPTDVEQLSFFSVSTKFQMSFIEQRVSHLPDDSLFLLLLLPI
jgi:hypothetical protein